MDSFRKCLLAVSVLLPWLLGFAAAGNPPTDELDVLPHHFLLHPAEQIHYTACPGGQPHCPDAKFAIADTNIVRIRDPKGILEAVAPGRTELIVQTPTAQRRINLRVEGTAQLPMMAVPYSTVHEITAKDTVLFVGHANRDGFDHTAVAKPGIDRLVQEAKKKGWPVVYFVSEEYPNWYTADRHPDYAIISEGQEHRISVKAQRVIFSGGDFMVCTLRNVQITLHGMLQLDDASRINFVFPAQAIWMGDTWGPGEKHPYPAPMLSLATILDRRTSDAQRYNEVVVPFLTSVITQYPVLNYPSDPPAPPLKDLLKAWSIVVRFADGFERLYQRGDDPNKTVLLEFQESAEIL